MKRSIRAVDIETGEVMSGITMMDEDDRRRRKEFFEAQRATKMRRLAHKEWGGYFFFIECKEGQFSGLTPQDAARLVYIASFIGYDGALKINERKDMEVNDVKKLLKLSEATFNRFWKAVSGRFIFQDGAGALTVRNGFSRGPQGKITERREKVFLQSIRSLYRNTPASRHRYLGYIFQHLDQISVQYNALCENPFEEDLNHVSLLTVQEFCRMIGYDKSQAARLRRVYDTITFEYGGVMKRFCAFTDFDRKTNDQFVIVNPHLFYAGERAEKVEILGKFFE